MSRPRIVLADDHRMMLDGLTSVLSAEFEVIDVVEDGAALVASARRLKPDVVVADITMPRLSGFEALDQLRKENPGIKVVFLTMHTEGAYARRALAAGAAGFVLKHSAATELVMAVRAALKGEILISPALAGEILNRSRQRAPASAVPSPTPRQREILELLANGLSAKRIADVLSISTRTVEFHKYQMMRSWGLQNTAELVHFAIRNGIVSV